MKPDQGTASLTFSSMIVMPTSQRPISIKIKVVIAKQDASLE